MGKKNNNNVHIDVKKIVTKMVEKTKKEKKYFYFIEWSELFSIIDN